MLLIPLFRYDPEYDGAGSTPIWANLVILSIIIICIWWSNSKRIEEFKQDIEWHDVYFWSKFLSVAKTLFLDIKESPLTFALCIAIVVLYWLILSYRWMLYVLIGVGLIIYLIWNKYNRNKK